MSSTKRAQNRFRVGVWAIIVGLVGFWSSVLMGDSAVKQLTTADVTAVKDVYVKQVETALNDEMKSLQGQLSNINKEDAPITWGKVNTQLKALQAKKKNLDNIKLADAMISTCRSMKQSMAQIMNDAVKSKRGLDVNADTIAAKRIAALESLKALNSAKTAYDYVENIRAFKRDLDKINESGLSPNTRRMVQAMTALTTLMSEFGGKVPMVGEVIKAYGQFAGGLVNKAAELDQALSKVTQGQLIRDGQGNYGIRKTMAQKVKICDKDPDIVAWVVPGLPKVYQNACDVMIWDSEIDDWHNAKESYPDKTVAQVKEMLSTRYLKYLAHKVTKPTPYQLLDGYEQAVLLEITPSRVSIQADSKISFTARAKWFRDSSPVTMPMKVKFKNKKLNLLTPTGGSFSADGDTILGKKMTWHAPDDTNGTYYVEADLAQKGYFAIRPADAAIKTGTPGQIQLSIKGAPSFSVGESVKLEAVLVSTEDGTPFSAKTAGGRFTVSCDACENAGGARLAMAKNATHSGIIERWKLPDTPGTYTFNVSYDPGSFVASSIIAKSVTREVAVVPPKFSMSVTPENAFADAENSAQYQWVVRNDDVLPLTLRFRRQLLSNQREYWQMSELPKELTLAAGEEKRVDFSMRVTNVENAQIQKVKWIALPNMVVGKNAKQWQKEAILEVRNDAFQGEFVSQVDGVGYQFGGGLPPKAKSQAHAKQAINRRLKVLNRKENQLLRAVQASRAEVTSLIGFYSDKQASLGKGTHGAMYAFLANKWYPEWQQVFSKFGETGLSNCMNDGNRALLKLGSFKHPEKPGEMYKITGSSGYAYYVLLSQLYYLKTERTILDNLKKLISRYHSEVMPEESLSQYEADYAERRSHVNGDVKPFGGKSNSLLFEKEVYALLSTPKKADAGGMDTEEVKETPASRYLGTWKGTAIISGELAQMAKRHGTYTPESSIIVVTEADGKLMIDLEKVVERGNEPLFYAQKWPTETRLVGNQIVWESRMSETLTYGFGRSRTHHLFQGFVGELQGDGNVMHGFTRMAISDIDIRYKCVLTREGSGAVANQAAADIAFDPLGLEDENASGEEDADQATIAIFPNDAIKRGNYSCPAEVFGVE